MHNFSKSFNFRLLEKMHYTMRGDQFRPKALETSGSGKSYAVGVVDLQRKV